SSQALRRFISGCRRLAHSSRTITAIKIGSNGQTIACWRRGPNKTMSDRRRAAHGSTVFGRPADYTNEARRRELPAPEPNKWHQSLTNRFSEVIHNFLGRQGFCASVQVLS